MTGRRVGKEGSQGHYIELSLSRLLSRSFPVKFLLLKCRNQPLPNGCPQYRLRIELLTVSFSQWHRAMTICWLEVPVDYLSAMQKRDSASNILHNFQYVDKRKRISPSNITFEILFSKLHVNEIYRQFSSLAPV